MMSAHFNNKIYGLGRFLKTFNQYFIIMAKTNSFVTGTSKVASGYATMQIISRPDGAVISLWPLAFGFHESDKIDVIFMGKVEAP